MLYFQLLSLLLAKVNVRGERLSGNGTLCDDLFILLKLLLNIKYLLLLFLGAFLLFPTRWFWNLFIMYVEYGRSSTEFCWWLLSEVFLFHGRSATLLLIQGKLYWMLVIIGVTGEGLLLLVVAIITRDVEEIFILLSNKLIPRSHLYCIVWQIHGHLSILKRIRACLHFQVDSWGILPFHTRWKPLVQCVVLILEEPAQVVASALAFFVTEQWGSLGTTLLAMGIARVVKESFHINLKVWWVFIR